ncbi:MAG TPA: cellulase family glycosylhydrolase [Dehalococcoidia bacterium]|nr:cellulase family glycosylhydrolase [Dehalococcoidia bacterium]
MAANPGRDMGWRTRAGAWAAGLAVLALAAGVGSGGARRDGGAGAWPAPAASGATASPAGASAQAWRAPQASEGSAAPTFMNAAGGGSVGLAEPPLSSAPVASAVVAGAAAETATPAAQPTPSLTPVAATQAVATPSPVAATPTAAAAGASSHWVGVNVWGLAASETVYDCGGSAAPFQQTLDSTFAHLRAAGVDVVRFWAFQSYATNAQHQRDWSALDAVFASAQAHGVRLIPVVGNNWRDCDYWPISLYPNGGQQKDQGPWYATGYASPYDGYLTSYRQWVVDIASRYAGNAALADWEVVNEPEGDGATLSAFFQDIIGGIRSGDAVTPISLGSIGTGQPGFAGGGYRSMLLLPGVGFATAHDYDHADDALPISPTCPYDANCIRTDIRDALAAGKPIFIGEAGDQGCDDAAKAARYAAKMRAAFAAGAAGYVLWAYRDDVAAGNCGYDFGPNGELIKVFAQF